MWSCLVKKGVWFTENEGVLLDFSVAVENEKYPRKGPSTDLRRELGVAFSREVLRPLGAQAGRLGIRNSCLMNCRPNFVLPERTSE